MVARRGWPAAAAVSLAALFACTARASVDEFQCACGHDALAHVRAVRAMLAVRDRDAVNVAAAYGPLATRMLLVAHRRPEPTARWLWLLNVYANTVRQLFEPRGRGHGLGRVDGAALMADAAALVEAEVAGYVAICAARGATDDGAVARWTRDRLEKRVLEEMALEQPGPAGDDAPREENFAPARLYLDHVAAAAAGGLSVAMPPDVGVDWRDAADGLARVYRLSRRKWVLGTRELVLYQKGFLSAVAASMMGFVLVHVTHCQRHWLSAGGRGGGGDDDADHGYVGEYERTWMSVADVLANFASYLDLGPEKYYRTLLDVAANPVRDHDGFREVKRTIERHIADVGGGLFGVAAVSAEAAAARADAAVAAVEGSTTDGGTGGGAAQPEPDASLIDLIALVDTNIGAAEKYIAAVRALLPGVNFRIVKDFMRSAHIWLT